MKKTGMIAIVGRPNAGKSTLLNRLLGMELSAVTPKPQTTREQVRGILTEEEGQIVFIDTPGVHRAREGGLNQFMVKQAQDALRGAHLVWYLVAPTSELKHEEPVLEILKGLKGVPLILLMTKMDEQVNEELEGKVKGFFEAEGVNVADLLRVSGKEGTGTPELLKKTWERLPEGPFLYPETDDVSDRPVRFFVAEMIRKQLFLQLGEEIPYSCAVLIENFHEDTKPIKIYATLFVERSSQKPILLGKDGKKIKSLGQKAREEIEVFLGEKVFLGLHVKVLENWTRDRNKLKQLGYNLPPAKKPQKQRPQQKSEGQREEKSE
jgi:GTPase